MPTLERAMLRRGGKWLGVLVALVLVAVAAAAWFLGLATFERHTGFFAPVFSVDGRSVIYAERSTTGISWGFGWQHFTPPAQARALSDSLRLQRLDLASGQAQTLEHWDGSPVVGRTLSQYRGSLFSWLHASLRPQEDGSIEYVFELALPRQPTSEIHQLRGHWRASGGQRGAWSGRPGGGAGASEPVISGSRELFALPGRESFPAAIVLLDHADRSMRVLASGPAYAGRYPEGPQLAALMETSRKAEHDHLREMNRIQRERVAEYRRQGMNEGEALLRAGRDLRDLGFYPKPRRWVATASDAKQAAAQSALPRLDVPEMEIKVGLLSDIAKAIAEPGTEVDKDPGKYIRHRDFGNSEKLDKLLDAGTTELLVAYMGRVYHLRLLPAAEAVRRPGRRGPEPPR